MILESDVHLFLVHHIKAGNTASFLYRDKEHGITMEKHTLVKENGSTGRTISYYFIDNDEREFLDLTSLVDAYNEKFKLMEESPEQEVKYFKVIVKKALETK